jgi:sucrose phosphorylase
MKNKIMLITYADSMGENLCDLSAVLNSAFKDEIGAVHILPFYPSSGDRGFAPITYTEVDPAFGDWKDIENIAKNHELMCDFMINHLSRRSPQFEDFVERHDDSVYADMFLRFSKFWPGGAPTKEQVAAINKRKPCAPAERIRFKDGTEEDVWCTFSAEQMDLDVTQQVTWEFIEKTLNVLADHGASCIRLDAFAFATKKAGTSCFFLVPQTWDIMARVNEILQRRNVSLLPEIHDSYRLQLDIAKHGYAVYDFVLPLMVLHTLYSGSNVRLKYWLNICPRNQQTTLDTHDGMGVVDVEGLLSEEEIQAVLDITQQNGLTFKWDYRGGAERQKRVYQIEGTYYSALGEDDQKYLLARAIQFFTPGIPQVYYVGLLAGSNDHEKAKRTGNPRDIGRHDYTVREIEEALKRPVVQKLKRLMCFRNNSCVFDGTMTLPECEDSKLRIRWEMNGDCAELIADLKTAHFLIRGSEAGANLEF